MLKSFEELEVWQKGHKLAVAIYAVTKLFPSEERFGLTIQLRRAAVSVPANIAEGFGRRSTRDFLRFLEIAGGSLYETRYYLILARDLTYLPLPDYSRLKNQADEVGRLLGGMIRSLRKRITEEK